MANGRGNRTSGHTIQKGSPTKQIDWDMCKRNLIRE